MTMQQKVASWKNYAFNKICLFTTDQKTPGQNDHASKPQPPKYLTQCVRRMSADIAYTNMKKQPKPDIRVQPDIRVHFQKSIASSISGFYCTCIEYLLWKNFWKLSPNEIFWFWFCLFVPCSVERCILTNDQLVRIISVHICTSRITHIPKRLSVPEV